MEGVVGSGWPRRHEAGEQGLKVAEELLELDPGLHHQGEDFSELVPRYQRPASLLRAQDIAPQLLHHTLPP
jgi:hypothetical protein